MPTPIHDFDDTLELLSRAKAGERDCLDRVLLRYRDRLLQRIRRLMGQTARDEAESGDLLHDVFVKVLDRFDGLELRNEESFLRWTMTIARNHVSNRLRRRRTFPRRATAAATIEGLDRTPSSDLARVEALQRLETALADLDPDHRRVVLLRHFDQLSFEEIGKRLGRSANAAQLLHSRVLLALSETIEPNGNA